MILTQVPDLDRKVGMLVYARPDVYVGNYLEFRQSSMTFIVKEVGINGLVADISLCLNSSDLRHKLEDLLLKHKYSLLIMCKDNLSTFDAVSVVSKALGSAKAGFAGLKDTNAYTCQFITVESTYLPRLARLVRGVVAEFRYLGGRVWVCATELGLNTNLRRGDLLGNSFTIKLLLKPGKSFDDVKEVLNNLRNALLPNYFGYQRFGSRRPITHLVGKELLLGNYEGAIDVLVGESSPYELSEVNEARKLFREGRLRDSLKLLPSKFWLERKVINELLNGKSAKEAIYSLGSKYLSLFIEAYQSYLFNLALSKLIIDLGSIEEVVSRCDVIKLPSINVRYSDDSCDSVVKEITKEYLSNASTEFVRFLRRGVRGTSFMVEELSIDYDGRYVVLNFRLSPSTYASVVLRELLRESVVDAF